MDKNVKKGGLGLLSTLTLIFVVLKMSGLVDWPWLWVLCPVWFPLLLAGLAFMAILVGGRIKKGKW